MNALASSQSSILDAPESRRQADTTAEIKQELGQFLTPEPIAALMSSLFVTSPKEIRLLDAGAGAGALTAAFVKRFCGTNNRPKKVSATAYEVDGAIIPALRETLRLCQAQCAQAEVEFHSEIRQGDFIEMSVPLVRGDLFSIPLTPFNAAILNPPYRKINSDSATRRLLREAGIETTNLYTGFLALAMKLLAEEGELVAITPRSFCNGPYFKPFREQFLKTMSLRQVHVFESRSAAFQQDAVLQENIIVHAIKSREKRGRVMISTSSGASGGAIVERECDYGEMVLPRDREQFIHLVTDESEQNVRRRMARFTTPFAKLEVAVSTGRVVDFRARDWLMAEPTERAVPLIYPCHFNGWSVRWPKPNSKKPNAILNLEKTQELLVPAGIYVLVKRFSSKEERRRIVACIYDPARIRADRVGFENHLNYFHANGAGLGMRFAKGLAAFLNSTLVDTYFRQFNGHTQVNATDLRSLKYPTRAELEALGDQIGDSFPEQADLDELIQKELF